MLGFEAAETVDAVGPAVTGTSVGDDVTALLFSLGGYAEYAVASTWTRKPEAVSWIDAATPVRYGAGLVDRVRAVGAVDAVFDAAGKGVLAARSTWRASPTGSSPCPTRRAGLRHRAGHDHLRDHRPARRRLSHDFKSGLVKPV